jgi:hypothetical protein
MLRGTRRNAEYCTVLIAAVRKSTPTNRNEPDSALRGAIVTIATINELQNPYGPQAIDHRCNSLPDGKVGGSKL